MNQTQGLPSDSDIFGLIENDHERVSDLIEAIEDALDSNPEMAESLYGQLRTELKVHSKAEETVVYPRLKQDSRTIDLAEDALEEHAEIDELSAQLDDLDAEDEEWEDTFHELKDAIKHHVDEEETEIFRGIREVLSAAEIETLTEDFSRAKEKFLRELHAA